METTYYVCAVIGGTLIFCQFVMTLFGMGGHHDVTGGDHVEVPGHGGDMHHGHDAETNWFLGMLTFRTLSAGLAFFGLVGIIGMRADLEAPVTMILALASGLAALFVVGWIMKSLVKLNIDGTVRIEKALGATGTVYIPIPPNNAGEGKVQVSVLQRTIEYRATAKDALPTGAKIKVIAIIGSDTVEVAPATE